MKVLEAVVVGCDDGVTVIWKLGRSDDLREGRADGTEVGRGVG